ncbi:MAG: hypothetical protein H0Z33_11750 [Bacillaceae bacterium]|nr:hypothetical protein [Bacillaceae bacterium]
MNENQKQKPHIPQRLNYIFLFVFLFFAALILRLAFVQLVHGEEYRYESQIMSTKTLPIAAPRGRILDRDGEVLVTNKPVFTVTYTQSQNIEVDEEELADKLASYLDDMSAEEVLTAMKGNGPKYIPRRIKVGLSEVEISRLVEHRTELPGIQVIEDPLREIREDAEGGGIASHVLGYIRQIRADELDEYMARGYRNTDRIGVIGLEKYYEDQLKGKDGEIEVKVNKDMETIERRVQIPPVPGNDLILTLDLEFQDKVEKILADSIKQIQNDPRNPRPYVEKATAVAMNPQTGEILALANYPDFNLNDYYEKGYSTIAGRELNLAIGSPHLVGSVVKPASAMMGLQEELITPSTTIFDRGYLQVGDRKLWNWRTGGHGRVDVQRAIKVSNNTFFYDLSLRLGNYPESVTEYKTKFKTVDYYFSQFGLGVKTGIDLPYEKKGYFSPYRQLGNLAYSLIGQQNSYTAIQLAQYVSTIANDGYRMRPYLVKEIRRGTIGEETLGPVLMKREPEVLNRVDIDSKYIELVQQGMRMVTETGGTGYWAFYKTPYTVAAKTGTAQNWQGDDHSTLIAYAPYENPEIAIAVIVPFGGSGSDTSGPIARKILDAYFGVEPEESQ